MLGLPASGIALIGAAPREAAGATWAEGRAAFGGLEAGREALLHYTTASGAWQVVPLDDSAGAALSFEWVASEVTPTGGIVLAGHDRHKRESVVTREPGGVFAEAPVPLAEELPGAGESSSSGESTGTGESSGPDEAGEEAVLEPGETLYPTSGQAEPVIAALEEADGRTGALVVPVRGKRAESLPPVVLHYDGAKWGREPVCEKYESGTCTPVSSKVTPLAISASSPGNAWLAASSSSEPLMLFRQVAESNGEDAWVRRQPASWLLGSGGAPQAGERATPLTTGPLLTAVDEGVWVDVQIALPTSSGTSIGDGTVLVSAGASGEVAGAYCYPTSMCPGDGSLGAKLPSDYGSFAWSGDGDGTRLVTGLPDGAMLTLDEGQDEFAYAVGDGAGGGGTAFGPGGEMLGHATEGGSPRGGAAFASLTEGWLGVSLEKEESYEPAPQVIHVTTESAGDPLTSWPVPFQRPLLAVASEPGKTPGEAGAEALAVGIDGEVVRYSPGSGWISEGIYNAAGEREDPTLRGIAWPEPERAYAVGNEGAMFVYLKATGLWESDPAKPFNFHANLTAIAFSPTDPNVGYAVGKQGVMLGYDKTWTQEALPPGLAEADFTSIAFAGKEAIATYRMPDTSTAGREEGGLIVNEGSGWRVEPAAQALLASLPEADDTILSKVAGTPDGGIVAAGPNVVIERDTSTSAWRFASEPIGEAWNVAALAAIEEGSSVRALIAIETTQASDPNSNLLYEGIDNPPPPAAGAPKLLIGPDPLPERSYLLRETANGWQDVETDDQPALTEEAPERPEPVLALLLDPDGSEGWAVGGQTGEQLSGGAESARAVVQTAAVMRYGAGPAPPEGESATIATSPERATFALGGDAQCVESCANLARQNPGADAWLSAAISRAGTVAGLHAFLYAGPHLPASAEKLEEPAFERELASYASLLQDPGSLHVYAAASTTDVGSESDGVSAFVGALGEHAPAGEAPGNTPKPPAGSAAYAFDSPGEGGTVRVIVLDYSAGPALSSGDTSKPSCPGAGAAPEDQLQWLCAQLQDARSERVPAIVLGNDDITNAAASDYASGDAPAVREVLVDQGASAYLFDSPGENVHETIGTGATALGAYGSGTLGYVQPPLDAEQEDEFHGASGFLLVSVDVAARKESNWAPVSATLAVNAGQVAASATNGTFLRRSQVALFEGLARRPAGGSKVVEGSRGFESEAPDPYTRLPEHCVGSSCETFIEPSYTFTSSDPEVGQFVEHNPNEANPRVLLQNTQQKPIPDEPRSSTGALNADDRFDLNAKGEAVNERGEAVSGSSGLFCAYNPGATTITISAGGLSYSMQVTVQQGSVEQPCGTVPVSTTPKTSEKAEAPAPAPNPPPPGTAPSKSPEVSPPLPAPLPKAPAPAPTPVQKPTPTPARAPQVPPAPAQLFPIPVLVPPPAPSLAQPTPPSGTAQVPVSSPLTQPVSAAEREDEVEEATEQVSNMAAYDEGGGAPVPYWSIGLVILAALAAAGLRPWGRDEEPVYAWARARARRRGR